jgi:flagella basal body P-ring formation protein FlgA
LLIRFQSAIGNPKSAMPKRSFAMYGNGRPLGLRKRMQIVTAVIILAWATQTLLHQWGYGAEVQPAAGEATEKFVPGSPRFAEGGTLEVRSDAKIYGSEVKLRQICRWADSDAQVFLPVADLVIARMDHGSPFRAITVDQIRTTLHDAGMNLGVVKFAGPLSCTITRSDASYDEQTALRLWAAAKDGKQEDAGTGRLEDDAGTRGRQDAEKENRAALPASESIPASPLPPVPASTSLEPAKSLRTLLAEDLSVRVGIPKEKLAITFNPADEKLLNLSEPLFKFNIQARRARDLGDVSWNVTILSGTGSQKGVVNATARAWQDQIVLSKSVSYGQVIQSDDVAERRVLSDQLPGDPLLERTQVVGQQAARELRVGSVMTARTVDAVPLAKPGQLVTITLTVGSVRIKTVARAVEAGAYGQAIRVRNETTQDTFEVVLTGPQQATMDPLPQGTKLVSNDH